MSENKTESSRHKKYNNQKQKEPMVKNKSKQRLKRKSSERKTSIKKTWEYFVQQSDSRTLLKNAWKSENFQKEYSDKINKLYKKYNK